MALEVETCGTTGPESDLTSEHPYRILRLRYRGWPRRRSPANSVTLNPSGTVMAFAAASGARPECATTSFLGGGPFCARCGKLGRAAWNRKLSLIHI